MKKIFSIILISISLVSYGQMSTVEQEVFDEINKVRADPKAYIPYIDEFLDVWDSNSAERATAEELKKELCKMKPLEPLVYSQELFNTCKKHAAYVKRTGTFVHSDCNCGENIQYGNNIPRYAVCDLLIDYRVPDRGHRENILNPEFRKCAVVYIEEVDDEINFFFIQQFK